KYLVQVSVNGDLTTGNNIMDFEVQLEGITKADIYADPQTGGNFVSGWTSVVIDTTGLVAPIDLKVVNNSGSEIKNVNSVMSIIQII
ncbi:MAG: hypothetical protein ACRC2K_13825, partial [Clostridium sp.]